MEADWSVLCDALDEGAAMWLPRDVDLLRARVVLPGCQLAEPHVFARGQVGDAGARAEDLVALANPAAAGALANPSRRFPPLQAPAPEEGAYT